MSFGFVQSKCLANILLRYFLFEFILSIFDLFKSDKCTLPPELIILFAIAKNLFYQFLIYLNQINVPYHLN